MLARVRGSKLSAITVVSGMNRVTVAIFVNLLRGNSAENFLASMALGGSSQETGCDGNIGGRGAVLYRQRTNRRVEDSFYRCNRFGIK